MKLSNLIGYNIPQSIIAAWQRRQGDYLLPLQERAVREGLLEIGASGSLPNLLITGPTSSGKSFCGEMAAVAALLQRRKAVLLVPLKSIAEEKYHDYTDCYRDIGLKTIIATGDHSENEADFRAGRFDLAVAVYEKFNRLLTLNLDILPKIGLIVVDELQMIADLRRGHELETALTKVLASGCRPRLIALSAVIDNRRELAEWLQCREIAETVRPVDLLQGVASGGYFHFRSFNSGREGREKLDLVTENDDLEKRLIDYLKKSRSQQLIFLKAKRDTINMAIALAAAVGWDSADGTVRQLEDEEDSSLNRSLRQTLSRGVAFHNADLTPGQRQAIENGYRRGEIRVIFSTTTLAMGVNLPAETVFLETMKYNNGRFGHRPALLPISLAEYRSIAGRAGRFGHDPGRPPGRAVVLARTDFEFEVLWSEYIDAHRQESLRSALLTRDIDDIVLDFIVSGLAGKREAVDRAFESSWYCRQGRKPTGEVLHQAADRLISGDFINADFQPRPLGRAAAEHGLSVASCGYYLAQLEKGYPQEEPGWLFLALTAAEFDPVLAGLTRREHRWRIFEKLLYQRFGDRIGEISRYTDGAVGREPLDFRTAAVLKAALVLYDWADGRPVVQMEAQYQLHHGQIINLADTGAWLISSLAGLIEAREPQSRLPRELRTMAYRVRFGINAETVEIHRAAGKILSRDDFRKLSAHQLTGLDDLEKTDPAHLAEVIESKRKANLLRQCIEHYKKEENMGRSMARPISGDWVGDRGKSGRPGLNDRNPAAAETFAGWSPSLLEIDGGYEKERYLVRVDGFPVRLTGKSFKYLAKLAASRLTGGEGWIYKDDIESGFNQARYLYRLKQELKQGGVVWDLFENNRLGYYRLNLEPSKVRFNVDSLKNHYDFELRQIAEQLPLRQAS